MEASKPVSVKQLKEHLQHQQEPFSLHNYLSERRYSVCSNIDSAKTIKYEKHKTGNRFLHAPRILRSLLCKFIPIGEVGMIAVADHYTINDDIAEAKVLPFQHQSSNLVMNTFTLPKFRRLEVDAGTEPHWISTIEKQQQHYTESKWRQPLPKSVCSVTAISTLSQKSARDPMLSTYLRKLLANSNILKLRRAKKDKLQEIVGTASLCRRNKRTLQKRKQMLYGCIEKARELQENKGNSDHFCLLDKQNGEVTRITHLLRTESCVISEEWASFHKLNREIHMEIGDAIVDDVVQEMLDIFLN